MPISLVLLQSLLLSSLLSDVCGQKKEDISNPNSGVTIAASVGGHEISLENVDLLAGMAVHRLEEQIYQTRRNALNILIERILISEEAKSVGVAPSQFITNLTAHIEVDETEVREAFKENLARFGPPNTSEIEAKEKLRATLLLDKKAAMLRQELSRLWSKFKPEIYLEEPQTYNLAVEESGPAIGSPEAPVTIVVFSDFQCPFSKQAASTVRKLLDIFSTDLRLIYKHFPGATHMNAVDAAKGAVCAAEQGKFWEYHDLLFENSQRLSVSHLKAYAERLGLAPSRFQSCLGSDGTLDRIEEDRREARRLGVTMTPSFVVNGRLLKGSIPFEYFRETVEKEIAKNR